MLFLQKRRTPKKRPPRKKGGRKSHQSLPMCATSVEDDDVADEGVPFVIEHVVDSDSQPEGVIPIRLPADAALEWEGKGTADLRHDVLLDFEHCFVRVFLVHFLLVSTVYVTFAVF